MSIENNSPLNFLACLRGTCSEWGEPSPKIRISSDNFKESEHFIVLL